MDPVDPQGCFKALFGAAMIGLIALIAAVGLGMAHTPGVAARATDENAHLLAKRNACDPGAGNHPMVIAKVAADEKYDRTCAEKGFV